MADVFISYKSERRAAAEHLAEILADYGYSVWWDYGLVSGREFGAQIESELRAAKAVVVLWCSLSRQSEWVLDEADMARKLGKVIPTMIENVELPLGWGRAQTLDLADWDGAPKSQRLERLLRDIAQLVARAPRPNLEGLDRTERAWRRFGAPSLREFALIDMIEKAGTPRFLPGALAVSAPTTSATNIGWMPLSATAAPPAAEQGALFWRSRWKFLHPGRLTSLALVLYGLWEFLGGLLPTLDLTHLSIAGGFVAFGVASLGFWSWLLRRPFLEWDAKQLKVWPRHSREWRDLEHVEDRPEVLRLKFKGRAFPVLVSASNDPERRLTEYALQRLRENLNA